LKFGVSLLRRLKYPIEPKPVLDDISVIIPTLGRPILESCLRWLADGSHWPRQVIVVDQGHNLVVAEWLEQLQSIGLTNLYVPSGKNGRSAGINRGLEKVQTRFVAITDDDCFVKADWLLKMATQLHHEPGTIVTGRVELAGDEAVAFSVVSSRIPKRYTKPRLNVHPFIGGNVGMSMEVVDRIGNFDEHPSLQSAEDSDYGYRALRLGIPVLYDPEIVLLHYHWRDTSQRAERYNEYSRSQGGFYGKHLLNGDPIIWVQAARALVRGPIRWGRGTFLRDKDMIDRGRSDSLELLPGIIAGVMRGRKL
jgi:GT2 family glycosyltransferase